MQKLRSCLEKSQPDGLHPCELLLFPFYDSRLRCESRNSLQKSIELYDDLQNLANQRLQSYLAGTIGSVWKRLSETQMRSANVVPLFWRQYLLNQTANVLNLLNAASITSMFVAFRQLNWFLNDRLFLKEVLHRFDVPEQEPKLDCKQEPKLEPNLVPKVEPREEPTLEPRQGPKQSALKPTHILRLAVWKFFVHQGIRPTPEIVRWLKLSEKPTNVESMIFSLLTEFRCCALLDVAPAPELVKVLIEFLRDSEKIDVAIVSRLCYAIALIASTQSANVDRFVLADLRKFFKRHLKLNEIEIQSAENREWLISSLRIYMVATDPTNVPRSTRQLVLSDWADELLIKMHNEFDRQRANKEYDYLHSYQRIVQVLNFL